MEGMRTSNFPSSPIAIARPKPPGETGRVSDPSQVWRCDRQVSDWETSFAAAARTALDTVGQRRHVSMLAGGCPAPDATHIAGQKAVTSASRRWCVHSCGIPPQPANSDTSSIPSLNSTAVSDSLNGSHTAPWHCPGTALAGESPEQPEPHHKKERHASHR